MTDAEIFLKVKIHLLTQGRRATRLGDKQNETLCAYREPLDDGTVRSCAVGCLIPATEYRPSFEGQSATSDPILDVLSRVVGRKIKRGEPTATMLYRLQGIHDDYPPHKWMNELAEMEKRFYANGEYNGW